jgi:hypothetical protein
MEEQGYIHNVKAPLQLHHQIGVFVQDVGADELFAHLVMVKEQVTTKL